MTDFENARREDKAEVAIRLVMESYDIHHAVDLRILITELLSKQFGLTFDYTDFIGSDAETGVALIDGKKTDVIVWTPGSYNGHCTFFTTDKHFITYARLYEMEWLELPNYYAFLCAHTCRKCNQRHDVHISTEDEKERSVNWHELNYKYLNRAHLSLLKMATTCWEINWKDMH